MRHPLSIRPDEYERLMRANMDLDIFLDDLRATGKPFKVSEDTVRDAFKYRSSQFADRPLVPMRFHHTAYWLADLREEGIWGVLFDNPNGEGYYYFQFIKP